MTFRNLPGPARVYAELSTPATVGTTPTVWNASTEGLTDADSDPVSSNHLVPVPEGYIWTGGPVRIDYSIRLSVPAVSASGQVNATIKLYDVPGVTAAGKVIVATHYDAEWCALDNIGITKRMSGQYIWRPSPTYPNLLVELTHEKANPQTVGDADIYIMPEYMFTPIP